jgi:antitoxin component HigA of HigAB toxin-antitoxin module
MNLKPIKTEKDYQLAIKEIEQLFDTQNNTD